MLLNSDLELIIEKQLKDEASCVAVSPFNSVPFATLGMSPAIAAATWLEATLAMSVYGPMLNEINKPTIPCRNHLLNVCAPHVPRALALTELNEMPYLFCASGDGLVVSLKLALGNAGQIESSGTRAISLGNLPVQIYAFRNIDTMATMALFCSERACVIRSDRLVVPFKSTVARIAAFGVSDWRNCVVAPHTNQDVAIIACHNEIAFCEIYVDQGIKISSVILNEQPHQFSVCYKLLLLHLAAL